MSTKQPDETQARWYMVNKDGMATLCKDQADAEQEAADAQAAWPGMGPHRAVQLVESPLMGAAGDAEFMRQVVAVAVTVLFDGYKEDVMRVFSTDELIEIVRITAPLRPQQVEDIYKRAWDALSTPSTTSQADSVQDEPLQAFDSPRAKALMRAWEEGWAACRDAEYVGEEAQNDAFNSSHTLTLCIAEDQQLPAPQADSQPAPIDMVLHCPACGLQHIDAPDAWRPGSDPLWDNPPHRSHLCHGCGHIWRPADVPTNGMEAVKTRGKADSPIAARAPAGLAQAETNEVMKLIAACRDAFPIPTSPAGDPLDTRWIAAMCDPSEVPGYLREIAARHAQAADSVGRDTARLDWLGRAGPTSICVVMDRDHDGEVEVSTDDVDGYGNTLREAIDAAMKKGANHD